MKNKITLTILAILICTAIYAQKNIELQNTDMTKKKDSIPSIQNECEFTPYYINNKLQYKNYKISKGPGDIAPDFTLKRIDSGSVTFQKERGKIVFIEFWATRCSGCWSPEIARAMNELDSLYSKYDFEVISIVNCIGKEKELNKIKNHLAKVKARYITLLEMSDNIHDQYCGSWGYPIWFLVDRDGKIVHGGVCIYEQLDSIKYEIEKLTKE